VDDEVPLRKLLTRILGLEGFAVTEAGTLKEAGRLLQQQVFDVVLCDVKLPDGNGIDFIAQVKQRQPLSEVILLTAYGNIPDGVLSIKQGAFDYITKGNDNDKIIPLLHQALHKVQAARARSVQVKQADGHGFSSITGASPLIRDAVTLATRVARRNVPVLLLGETGTGKEVFANAIHCESDRAGQALVAINCSAFSHELLESELFGHLAGAFTGAAKDKKGLVEAAHKGSLFLDEVGELPVDLQAKLLRFLEDGSFLKVGDTQPRQVDVRIIAATNRHLPNLINAGQFREDLYYRLNVFSIHLPPLRDRREDIPALARGFAAAVAQQDHLPALNIAPEALALLQRFDWKGNLRELKNVIRRASVMADSDTITTTDLPYDIQQQAATTGDGFSLAGVEQLHIRKILQFTRNNKTRAAELLGIGLTTLYRKMEEYGIEK
jgi:DNA-binding NtrC family response regulator